MNVQYFILCFEYGGSDLFLKVSYLFIKIHFTALQRIRQNW